MGPRRVTYDICGNPCLCYTAVRPGLVFTLLASRWRAGCFSCSINPPPPPTHTHAHAQKNVAVISGARILPRPEQSLKNYLYSNVMNFRTADANNTEFVKTMRDEILSLTGEPNVAQVWREEGGLWT